MARIKPNITFGHHSSGRRFSGAFGACGAEGAAGNKGVTSLRAFGAPALDRFFLDFDLILTFGSVGSEGSGERSELRLMSDPHNTT